MPIYNFKCGSCEKLDEKFVHKILSEETFPCSCGGEMKRVFEGSSLNLGNVTPWRKGLTIEQQAAKLEGNGNREWV